MPFTHDEAKKFIINFGIAGVTSTVAKTLVAPFERVKLILQNQGSALQILTGERPQYKGIIDCLIRLPHEQGFLSLWRGNGVNVLRYFPTQALNFAFNDFFKQRFFKSVGKDSPTASVITKFLAGGLAGGFTSTIVYPLEFCTTRITVDVGSDAAASTKKVVKREFQGLTDCVVKVRRADGYRGLYRGYGVAVMGISVYRASYFGLFDIVKRIWAWEAVHHHHEVTKPPLLLGLLFAQTVTVLSGIFSYPLDTLGRRLMMEAGRPKELRLFHTTLDAAKYIYRREGGFVAFYRGIAANCLRGISGALVLVFYDEILHYTKWKEWLSPCDNC